MSITRALNIPFLVIAIVLTAVITVALFPTLDQSFTNLTSVNTTNPLITAIRPALPFLSGLALLLFILAPILFAIGRMKRKW